MLSTTKKKKIMNIPYLVAIVDRHKLAHDNTYDFSRAVFFWGGGGGGGGMGCCFNGLRNSSSGIKCKQRTQTSKIMPKRSCFLCCQFTTISEVFKAHLESFWS